MISVVLLVEGLFHSTAEQNVIHHLLPRSLALSLHCYWLLARQAASGSAPDSETCHLSPQHLSRAVITKKFNYLLVKTGTLMLKARSDLRGYIPGQVIRLAAEIHNKSGKDTGCVLASLIQVVRHSQHHRAAREENLEEIKPCFYLYASLSG